MTKTKLSLLIILATIGIINQSLAQGFSDTVSFETPNTVIVIDTNGGNLWQIGTPQKTFFSSAHSGVNAILTDTINNFPPNDTSSFIYIIRNPYTQTCQTCMEFWHKYDMDSLGDQGIIDASYDGGNSWLQVIDTFPPFGAFFSWMGDYHPVSGTYTSHPLVTYGKSDGWIKSTFCWQWWIPVKKDTIISNPDSLMIRFTFISDSIIKSKEGWMIDDIVTSSAAWNDCSGIKENDALNTFIVYPNPFSISTTIQTSDILENATLIIYNSFGQEVKQLKNISGQTITLQREDLTCGIYFIRLTQNNKVIATEKLIITDL